MVRDLFFSLLKLLSTLICLNPYFSRQKKALVYRKQCMLGTQLKPNTQQTELNL